MMRALVVSVGVVVVGAGVMACERSSGGSARHALAELPAGTYGVQQVQYDDATGLYRVMVLEVPAGTRPLWESEDVRMARLDDAALQAGKVSTLTVEGQGGTLHLTPDFQVAYVHNVTEQRTNPMTGGAETVVLRQETGFWTPFAASMAGSMMANALFAPHYVYPPVYAPGGLRGVGAFGTTRSSALQSYQATHGTLPQPARLAAAGAPLRMRGDAVKGAPGGVGSSKFKTSPVSKPRSFGRPFGIRRR